MPKLRYVGDGHHRIIDGVDLAAHGLTNVSIDMWRGDIVDLPDDVAKWLLSEYSNEAAHWEPVDPTTPITLGANKPLFASEPDGEPLVPGLNSDNTNPGEPETEANEGSKKKK